MISLLFDLFVISPVLGDERRPHPARLLSAMLLCFLFVIGFGLILVGEIG